MPTSLRVCLLTLAAFALTWQANAGTDLGPADTATWVSSCDTNFEACRHEVVNVYNLNVIDILSGAPGCTFPSTGEGKTHADSIPATHAIVDWLNANAGKRSAKTDDAVNQALAALWPKLCKP